MPDLKSRLKLVREQLPAARDAHKVAVTEAESAKAAFESADHDGPLKEWPEYQALQEAVKTMGAADDKVNDLQEADRELVQLAGQLGGTRHAGGQGGTPDLMTVVSGVEALLRSSEEYQAHIEAGTFRSKSHFGVVEMGEMVKREYLGHFLKGGFQADAIPGAPGNPFSTDQSSSLIIPDYRGLISPVLRQLTLLDIIGTGTTDSNLIKYVQETGLPLGAAETPEGGLKPELGISFTDASAEVKTIAGWIKVNRQAMDDVPGIATILNQQLPYSVRVRLENQIVQGDGTGENLTGILNTTGIVSETATGSDNTADTVLKLMTQLYLGDAIPNFVAVHPLVRQGLLLLRSEEGGANTGQYLYGGPGVQAAPTLWGMNLIQSRILATDIAFVGDSNAATLMVREGINVKTSDSDQDDFIRNRVTLLAECRVALPVWRPSHFGTTTLN